jgi:hypothetical protein
MDGLVFYAEMLALAALAVKLVLAFTASIAIGCTILVGYVVRDIINMVRIRRERRRQRGLH